MKENKRPGRFFRKKKSQVVALCLCILPVTAPLSAQETEGGNVNLAKKLANPISDLVSVPFQLRYNSGYGPDDGSQYLLNIQPVIPFSISEDWNVISRTILPLVNKDSDMPGGSAQGLGDTTQSFFFSPKAPTSGGLIWGAGPAFLVPTATEDNLGTGKWGAGLTGVVLKQEGPWTVGGLANHIWSFAGESDRADVNNTFIQPFMAYTTKTATSFVLNTESTYDWETSEWSVPVNLLVNQMFKLGGKRPAQIGFGVRYWADAPENGPEGWGAQLNFTLLYPKRPN